jgi:hypothetical protein
MSTWWRGTGRRRAADRIPELTAERDQWILLALWQAHQIAYRDRQLDLANQQTARLAAKADAVTPLRFATYAPNQPTENAA